MSSASSIGRAGLPNELSLGRVAKKDAGNGAFGDLVREQKTPQKAAARADGVAPKTLDSRLREKHAAHAGEDTGRATPLDRDSPHAGRAVSTAGDAVDAAKPESNGKVAANANVAAELVVGFAADTVEIMLPANSEADAASLAATAIPAKGKDIPTAQNGGGQPGDDSTTAFGTQPGQVPHPPAHGEAASVRPAADKHPQRAETRPAKALEAGDAATKTRVRDSRPDDSDTVKSSKAIDVDAVKESPEPAAEPAIVLPSTPTPVPLVTPVASSRAERRSAANDAPTQGAGQAEIVVASTDSNQRTATDGADAGEKVRSTDEPPKDRKPTASAPSVRPLETTALKSQPAATQTAFQAELTAAAARYSIAGETGGRRAMPEPAATAPGRVDTSGDEASPEIRIVSGSESRFAPVSFQSLMPSALGGPALSPARTGAETAPSPVDAKVEEAETDAAETAPKAKRTALPAASAAATAASSAPGAAANVQTAAPAPSLTPTVAAAIAGEASWRPTNGAEKTQSATHGAPTEPKTLSIQLHPAELGMVTATLKLAGGQLTVELAAETQEARNRLASETGAIVKSLRDLGLDVEQVSVVQPAAAQAPQTRGPDAAPQPSAMRDPQTSGGSAGGDRLGGGQARRDDHDGTPSRPAQGAAPAARAGSGLYI